MIFGRSFTCSSALARMIAFEYTLRNKVFR